MMATNYAQIIGNATQAYNNTLAGYRTQLAQQQQQQQGVVQGYNDLQKGVLGGLEGQSAAAGQDIAGRYRQDAAKQLADATSRGMANNSFLSSLNARLSFDQSRAQEGRIADFAGRAADKTTQLGLAGLGYAGHALDQNMQFAGQGLQYGGQGAFQIGNLAQGFAGLENQSAMQQAGFDQQMKVLRNNQMYGGGHGGGVPGNSDPNKPMGAASPYGAASGGGGGRSYDPYATPSASHPAHLPIDNSGLSGEFFSGGQTLYGGGGGGGSMVYPPGQQPYSANDATVDEWAGWSPGGDGLYYQD